MAKIIMLYYRNVIKKIENSSFFKGSGHFALFATCILNRRLIQNSSVTK